MKIEDFTHPSSKHLLRARLVKEQHIVTVIQQSQFKETGNEIHITGIGDLDGNLLKAGQGVDYVVGKDAFLLHPTGGWGKKMCPKCEGFKQIIVGSHDSSLGIPRLRKVGIDCPECDGTGYVPTMIYQGDVLWFPSVRAPGIIFWQSNRRGFAIQFQGHIQDAYIYLDADVTHDIILGTALEPDKIVWPNNVSPEYKAGVLAESKELLESLAIKGETS